MTVRAKRFSLVFAGSALAMALAPAAPDAAGQAPPPVFAAIHNFAGSPDDGAMPWGLVRSGNMFYGATWGGGAAGCGTVFSLAPPGGHWTEKILYSFTCGNDGAFPLGLALGNRGTLYGTTASGGNTEFGTVFSLMAPAAPGAAWTLTVLHTFTEAQSGAPSGGLAIGKGGVLYGTTYGGESCNNGTVFALKPPASPGGSWTEETVHCFPNGGAEETPASVAIDPASGTIYGTTSGGRPSPESTVFSLSPPTASDGDWREAAIYTFTGGDDGLRPNPLLLGPDGIVYGTSHGTGNKKGAVFSLTPPASPGGSWRLDVLHDFPGAPDGSVPGAGLAMGSDGTLYGTTILGGAGGCVNGCGTVFSMTPPATPGGGWTETVVYSFNGAGNGPAAPVTFGKNGLLYGTTQHGGTAGDGIVFSLAPQ